jgi:Na+-transporting methylmalonyl-CoA/oxaloacetate decarboxylase gamma subunit
MSQEALNIFYQALTITYQGMAGIFIFMFIFFLIIKLIDKVFPKEKE